MYDYDREYFNRQNAVISELVRQVTSMCDDIQMRLDEMDFVLEEMRVERKPVPKEWIPLEARCDCDICRCQPSDYRMD